MTDDEILAELKNRLLIMDSYHDNTLISFIVDVRNYLLSAGVSADVLTDIQSMGIYYRGVADCWNYGAGDGVFSPYFYQRAIQLIYNPQALNSETVST